MILRMLIGLLLLGSFLGAKETYKVKITEDIPYVDVDIKGIPVRIQRIQDTKHRLRNSYIRTSRPTPPFYIQPFEPIKGVETYGELETIRFIQNNLNNDTGILIDARMPQWFKQGTIPGAINLPFSILTIKKYADKVLEQLGVTKKGGKYDFSHAMTLLIFDNGPWCQQATTEIKHLLALGYPKQKIKYYRGGMQFWQIVGLTVLNPVTLKPVKY